jgi:hypothetical protein
MEHLLMFRLNAHLPESNKYPYQIIGNGGWIVEQLIFFIRDNQQWW